MYLILNNFTVPGYGLMVGSNVDFKMEDASGDSSSTATANKGIKAKRLNVRVFINYDKAADLEALVKVAQAKSGSRGKLYTVTNRTANALGIRKASFVDRLRIDEQESINRWLVQFTLQESQSVPEMKEARQTPPPTVAQVNPGQAVNPTPDETEQLTDFEKWLVSVDEKIGG